MPALDKKKNHSIDVVVDRLVIPAAADPSFTTRLTDSVELGLKTGNGIIVVEHTGTTGVSPVENKPSSFIFSEKNAWSELRTRSSASLPWFSPRKTPAPTAASPSTS